MVRDFKERVEKTADFHCELDRAASAYGRGEDREKNLGLITSRCQVDLERYFASRKVPQSDAEDLVQETLITVAETLDRFRGDACVRTWVTKIAENNLYLRWNRRKTSSQIESDQDFLAEAGASALSPEEEVARSELSALVRDEVRKLPSRMRACLELKLYQDRSYKEIAAILGMNIGAVGVTLKNAEERLKKALGGCINVDGRDFNLS